MISIVLAQREEEGATVLCVVNKLTQLWKNIFAMAAWRGHLEKPLGEKAAKLL